jgi:Mg/Co/Ni transporter MgtE
MSSATELSLAFLERAPSPAARTLETLPLEQASAYLASVPARLAAPVANAMTPWHAARVLERLEPARAALVLRQLAFVDVTSLVRAMRPELRLHVFAELPTRYAQRLARSMQYPTHQVGAWIDPGVPALATNNTVADALGALRATGTASHVFVESERHGRYIGAITVREILCGEPAAPLAALETVHAKPVSNRASLVSIAFDSRWDEMLHLPVVGRRGNLLGGLSRNALRKGVHEYAESRPARARTLIGASTGALLLTCAGIARLLTGTLDTRAPESSTSSTHER